MENNKIEIAKFEVGKKYHVTFRNDFSKNGKELKTKGTVTKKTKCYVFFLLEGGRYTWQVKVRKNDKTEFTTETTGILFAASADNPVEPEI